MISIIKKELRLTGKVSLFELPGAPDGGTTGVVVFDSENKNPIAFVKIFRDGADNRINTEIDVLNLIGDSGNPISSRIPKYLFNHKSKIASFLGQTIVSGAPLIIKSKNNYFCELDFEIKLRIITDFLINLAKISYKRKGCSVIEHGDFSAHNILLDKNKVSVIDWSDSVLDGKLLFDYFNFVMNTMFKLRNTSSSAEFVRIFRLAFFEKNQFSALIKKYAYLYLGALEIDKSNAKSLFGQYIDVYFHREKDKNIKAKSTGFLPSYVYKLNVNQDLDIAFLGIFDVLIQSMKDNHLESIFNEY